MPPVAPWLEEAMLPLAAGAGKKAKFRHVLSDAAAVVPQAPRLLAPPFVAQALTLKEFTPNLPPMTDIETTEIPTEHCRRGTRKRRQPTFHDDNSD